MDFLIEDFEYAVYNPTYQVVHYFKDWDKLQEFAHKFRPLVKLNEDGYILFTRIDGTFVQYVL